MLCASIIAASVINTHRQAAANAAARPSLETTDQQALLPNLFTLGPGTPTDGNRTVTGLPLPNKGAAATSIDTGPGAATQPEQKKGASSHPVLAESPINAELVRRYYDLLANHPNQALGLLDDALLGSDMSRFVSSWSQVRGIQVLDVQQRPDGLLAIVEAVLPDGGTARVQQLLKVTSTSPQRITGAEIISAQRS